VKAANANVDMLTLPELFLPGYDACVKGGDMPDESRVADMCAKHGVALTIGLPEQSGDRLYNASISFAADGSILARFRKVQLFGPAEAAIFTPGDQHVVFDYMGTRFGVLICYDVEFPEHVRALVKAGAKVILVPTANMMPFINVNLIGVPGRAFENGVTIVYANYTGSEGSLDYTGHSQIAGPDGYALAAKGMGQGLITAEVPDDLLENGIPFSTQLADYRPVKDPK